MGIPNEINGVEIVAMKPTEDGRLRVWLKGARETLGYEQEVGESEIDFINELKTRLSSTDTAEDPKDALHTKSASSTPAGWKPSDIGAVVSSFKSLQVLLSVVIVILALIAVLLLQNT